MTQFRIGTRWMMLGVLVAVGLFGMPGEAWGQTLSDLLVAGGQPLLGGETQVVQPGAPKTFGIASEVAHVVGAWDFDASFGTPAAASNFGERFCTGGPCFLHASLRLPSGAVVSRMELDACDANGANTIGFTMFQTTSPATGAATFLSPNGTTGATPGCALFTQALTAPVTIDNKTFNYFLEVRLSATDPDLNFSAVRVYYTLQVSPAPAVATFTDVPMSHAFFRFVEALVRAGITVGCGAGQYCVNNPITRGEMAVFLSKALGLHFAP